MFKRLSRKNSSAPTSAPAGVGASALPRRYASGGQLGSELAQAVPALSVPYVAVQKAAPLRYDDIDVKLRSKSDENLAKLAEETDKVWNDKMKSLDLLPVYQEQLNQYRKTFLDGVQSRVREDGAFLGSTANRLAVQQSFLSALDSGQIKTMVQNTKDHEEEWKQIREAHKEKDMRYVNGQRTGLTNERYHQILRNSSDRDAQELLGGFGSGEPGASRPLGNMTLTTRFGSMEKDAIPEIDKIAAIAEMSRTAGEGKTFSLTDAYKTQLGTSSDAVLTHLRSSGVKTNADALKSLSAFFGNGWRQNLSGKTVEGLEDHFDQQFSRTQGVPFSVQLTNGRILDSNTETVANVEAAARAGQIKNADQVLAKIEHQRSAYIDDQAQRYVRQRIMGRVSVDQESKNEWGLQDRGTALTDAEKAAKNPESDFNTAEYQRLLQGQGGFHANDPQSGKTIDWMRFGYTADALQQRRAAYLPTGGIDLQSAAAGRGFTVPGLPNADLYGELKGTDQMRILAVTGDAAHEQVPPAVIAQTKQQLEDLKAALFNIPKGTMKPAQLQQLQLEAQAKEQEYYSQLDANKTQIRHMVRVAMPLDVLQANPTLNMWQSKAGQTESLFRLQNEFIHGKGTLDEDKLGQANPHGIEVRKLTAAEAHAAGIPVPKTSSGGEKAETDQPYAILEMAINGKPHDVLNDPTYKGRGQFMNQQLQQARQGEVNGTVSNANWLTPYLHPTTTPVP